jgi:hypothetical protein
VPVLPTGFCKLGNSRRTRRQSALKMTQFISDVTLGNFMRKKMLSNAKMKCPKTTMHFSFINYFLALFSNIFEFLEITYQETSDPF